MSTKIMQQDANVIGANKLRPSIDTDLASRVNKLSMENKSSEPAGVSRYFETKIQNLALQVNEKGNNVRRLQAQRNEMNTKVRALREELQLLHEQASYVGEIIKGIFELSCSPDSSFLAPRRGIKKAPEKFSSDPSIRKKSSSKSTQKANTSSTSIKTSKSKIAYPTRG